MVADKAVSPARIIIINSVFKMGRMGLFKIKSL